MNTGLAVFAFLMIVLGAVSGFYAVSILGGFLLIAALVAPSGRPPPRPRPTQTERRRVTTPAVQPAAPAAMHEPVQPQPQAASMMPQPGEAKAPVAIPALFPTTMFPSMNPVPSYQQQAEQKPHGEKVESRDEIVELAAIAVFLRLLSG